MLSRIGKSKEKQCKRTRVKTVRSVRNKISKQLKKSIPETGY